MIRSQIQFREEQIRALKARALREKLSISEIVRRAVDAWVESDKAITSGERRRRAVGVSGQFASGAGDGARRHDDYLAGAYRS